MRPCAQARIRPRVYDATAMHALATSRGQSTRARDGAVRTRTAVPRGSALPQATEPREIWTKRVSLLRRALAHLREALLPAELSGEASFDRAGGAVRAIARQQGLLERVTGSNGPRRLHTNRCGGFAMPAAKDHQDCPRARRLVRSAKPSTLRGVSVRKFGRPARAAMTVGSRTSAYLFVKELWVGRLACSERQAGGYDVRLRLCEAAIQPAETTQRDLPFTLAVLHASLGRVMQDGRARWYREGSG